MTVSQSVRLGLLLLATVASACSGAEPAVTPVAAPAPSAAEALNALDTRMPVPMQPMMADHQKRNMRGHLEAMQQVTAALAHEDWEGVAEAAGRMGSSPEMAMMCTHMGAGAEGLPPLALSFHEQADAIAVAAGQRDTQAVLEATARTLEVCTTCHAQYRQDVVSAAVWDERVGAMGG